MKSPRLLATVLLATTLLSVSAFAAPASAAPTVTSWSGRQPSPGSSVSRAPGAVSVDASSSGTLSNASARMTVDGTQYQCFVTNPLGASGHWEYTEVWDDEAEEYVTTQLWVRDPDLTKATLLTYAWNGPLGNDGEHTVVASIKGADGNTISDTWSFSVKIPPKFGSPSPTNGSTVKTTSPEISVPVSDNGIVALWDVTVDGRPTSATLIAGVLHITPDTALRDGATVNVAATIRDAVGATASLSWSFAVQTHASMANMRDSCLECHPGYDAHPDMTPDCAECHNGVIDTPHEGEPAAFHVPAGTSCAPCHLRSLPNEHARRESAPGSPLTCMTCHKSTDPKVISAIASRSSNCQSCHGEVDTAHDGVGSATKHNPAAASSACLMSGCHATASIASLHSSATTTVAGDQRTYCAVCHADGTPAGPECSRCHADKLTAMGVVAEHGVDPARHVGNDSNARSGGIGVGCSGQPGRASGCHNISNLPTLHSGAPGGPCVVCHGPGKTRSTDCRSCHPAGSGAATASSLAGTGLYHHSNLKYLNDPSDETTSTYYWSGTGAPVHGWNTTLFYQDCQQCHIMHISGP